MSFLQLFLIAAALSMDAFAAAVCKGLSMKAMNWKHALIIGFYFGSFQAAMPLAGYAVGTRFQGAIERCDHWLAFILLFSIGLNMIRESFSKEDDCCNDKVDMGNMMILALATSIDALAVGVTLAFLGIHMVPAVSFIGITTFFFSVIGVKIGNACGNRYKSKAEFCGGLILISIGIKILFEHIGAL